MASVGSKNTKPELVVRRLLHRLGYRFRLHSKKLPGKPDIVLPRYRTVIFVNGCFWHQHSNCTKAKRPTTRVDFWNRKLDENVERDSKNFRLLETQGWKVIIVWECEFKEIENLARRLGKEISL